MYFPVTEFITCILNHIFAYWDVLNHIFAYRDVLKRDLNAFSIIDTAWEKTGLQQNREVIH